VEMMSQVNLEFRSFHSLLPVSLHIEEIDDGIASFERFLFRSASFCGQTV
jgi:hypothetical protein